MPTTDLETRIPPHNLEAERGVIGGVLRDPDALPDVQAVLRPESFYSFAHQEIFRVVSDLAAESKPFDLVLIRERLKAARTLEDCGGAEYLAELWDAVATAANVVYHARIVRDHADVRAVIHTANVLLRDAYDRVCPADELVAQAERSLLDLAADGGADDVVGPADLARAALRTIDDRRAARGGVLTGFDDLDRVLHGLRGGQLVVVGARPACGKTALALAVASNVAAAGTPVLFCSLEMDRGELMERLLAMRSGVPMRTIQGGNLNPDQAGMVCEAARRFEGDPFHLLAPGDVTVSRLAAVVRRSIRKRGIGLVVIDYLQLVTPENPRDQRHLQVAAMTRRLKLLAMSAGVPIVLLCQLNRESETRAGGRPQLSDLRESGSIEQDADVVLLMHRQANATCNRTDVIVAKNRSGPTADVSLTYRANLTRFENATAV